MKSPVSSLWDSLASLAYPGLTPWAIKSRPSGAGRETLDDANVAKCYLSRETSADFLPFRPFICYPIAAFESESVVEQLLANQLALPLVPPNPFQRK